VAVPGAAPGAGDAWTARRTRRRIRAASPLPFFSCCMRRSFHTGWSLSAPPATAGSDTMPGLRAQAQRRNVCCPTARSMSWPKARAPGPRGSTAVTVDVVVLGLGYVGLPLAHEAARTGLTVVGFDISSNVVDGLNAGRSHVDDLSDADIAEMLEAGFRATSDPGELTTASTIVVCVPTPLASDGSPDLEAVTGAIQTVARQLQPGQVIILESTTWPGTTEEIVQPLLEESGFTAGTDFHLAFSPERIDPGNPTYGIKNTPKVVGGVTPTCTQRAADFYRQFIDTVVPAKGSREAETAKLL